MAIMDNYGRMSGYKLNTKTQVLSLNYIPSKAIRQKYKLNWEAKSMKYLGVLITQELNKLYETIYNILKNKIQKDMTKWSTVVMDFSSRIEVVKINGLPRLFYLLFFFCHYQSIPEPQFTAWEKQLSRFIWAGARPRVIFKTLQIDKENGGLTLPNLKEHYYAAQMRCIVSWCSQSI